MIDFTRAEAIHEMNMMGNDGQPFIFVVDYKQQHFILGKPEEIDSSELLYDFNGFSNLPKGSEDDINACEGGVNDILWEPTYQSFDEYSRSFEIVKRNIYAGNSYLVNLTCATPVRTNLTLSDIFHRSKAMYRLMWRNRFVVFSPEIFVRIKDGYIYSYPMKGTIDASLDNAQDRILSDPKESAEHATIVDLIRNDLSVTANNVSVPRYRYIDKLKTNRGELLQVSSEIRGRLPEEWKGCLGDIILGMLPAGSITGAPKCETLRIISEAESYDRGFYTGIMGYFDGSSLDSAVMIRFMEEVSPGNYLFKSGGGITSKSDVRSEYEEMKQKVYVPIY